MVTYNLLDERWIPCTMLDGTASAESIRTVLEHAHERIEITTPSPVVAISLHRLLLAVIHRAIRPSSAAAGPADAGEWEVFWQRGAFDMTMIGGYLDSQRANFDLFDAARPFYQDAALDPQYARSVTSITHEMTTDGAILFDHTTQEDNVAFTPAQAARYLVTYHAFALGGRITFEKGQNGDLYGSADAGPLTKGATILVRGDTLFQTLMLNLVRYDRRDDEPFAMHLDDLPAWERTSPTRAEDRLPLGYLDYLTWQSRRIRLYPEVQDSGEVVVHRVTAMKGYQFPDIGSRFTRETMLAFRTIPKATKDQDPYPAVALQRERSVWRDSNALFFAVPKERPRTLRWLEELDAAAVLRSSLVCQLDIYGLCVSRGSVFFWRHERLPLPLAYLNDADLRAILDTALRLAESVGRVLRIATHRFACWMYVPEPSMDGKDAERKKQYAEKTGRGKQINDLRNALAPGRRYWPMLDSSFSAFVVMQAEERVRDGTIGQIAIGPAFRQWSEAVQRAAWADFHAMFGTLAPTAQSFQAWAFAERYFVSGLRRAMESAGVPESDSGLKGEEMVTDDA